MKFRTKSKVSLLFVTLMAWSTQGIGMEQAKTKETVLENGLKVVVREDNRAPVVVSQIWYKVGASNEYRGITGVSHALEHMMFQGTPNLPGDGFSKLISKHGGQDNAFTGEDYTAYYEELDAAKLPIAFELEADRMQNLILSPEAFAKELQVVIEERRLRTDDNPQSYTYERFMAVAHPMGPYHHPVIGWQSDLDVMTVEKLRHWYEKWYAPNNATLVVVGDVKAEEVFALAKKYFGAIPKSKIEDPILHQDIEPKGERRIKVHAKANLPYMIWGYEVPSLRTIQEQKDAFALWVLAALLDIGESARFQKELIRGEEVAASLSAHYDLLKKYDTQFIIAGIPAQNANLATLEQKVMQQVSRLQQNLVPADELARVKTQLLAHEIFEKDSMSDQAILLGVLETVGLPWQLVDEFYERIEAVTREDVQRVAKTYLTPMRLTVAELVPEQIQQ